MKKWLSKLKSDLKPGTASNNSKLENMELAIAVLLVEIMHADHQLELDEEKIIIELLQEQPGIDHDTAGSLFTQANRLMDDAVSLHKYTSLIHDSMEYDRKFNLLVSLWKVAVSDGHVDRYEEHLIRKLAELLYISHSDYIKAKHIAQGSIL